MKLFINKSIIFLSLIVSVFSSGCKKQLDINVSPNTPSADQGTPKLVLPAAIIGIVARTGSDYAILGSIWGEYATQSALSSQYRQIDSYNLDGSQLNGAYTGLYSSGLKNLQFIIDKSEDAEDWNFYLIGTVLKAYTTAFLVDLYDQIPYTEALAGKNNLSPKFDDGKLIYTDLIASLDKALSKDFSASGVTSPGKVDLIFPGVGNTDIDAEVNWLSSGNIEKWKQFANTLKLKLYLRMINTDPSTAQSGIQALYSSGATFLNEDAKVTGFTDVAGKDNPMYEQNIRQLNTPDNLRASRTLASFLQNTGDPRITYYYSTANPGSIHQGDYASSDPAYGNAARLAQRPTDPVVLISKAESLLLQAEARERYFAGSNAKSLYDAGVQQSFTDMGAGSATTLLQGAYAYPTSGTLAQKIEAIIVQKWISFGYGVHYIEGFFERNRTGYPKSSTVYSTSTSYIPGQFVVSKTSVLGNTTYPKRLQIPDAERLRNSNAPSPVAISTKVWWGL